MARENIGQILIDNEVVKAVGELRRLLAQGAVRQGERTITHKDEVLDTKDGPIFVGNSVTIYTWEDSFLN